jgi:hypothetical protein
MAKNPSDEKTADLPAEGEDSAPVEPVENRGSDSYWLTIRVPRHVAVRADAVRARLLGELSKLPPVLENGIRDQLGNNPGNITRGAMLDIALHSVELWLDGMAVMSGAEASVESKRLTKKSK